MENIQVALRMRPLNRKEAERKEENIWTIHQKKTIAISNYHAKELLSIRKINPSTKNAFTYDYCYSPDDDNFEVYAKSVKRIALSSLGGINGTIFMYGQTGSGKTYSMMGFNKNEESEASDKSSTTLGERVHPSYSGLSRSNTGGGKSDKCMKVEAIKTILMGMIRMMSGIISSLIMLEMLVSSY